MSIILKNKITFPILIAASILSITLLSYASIEVNAEYDKLTIPEISGTITVLESSDGDYSDDAQIVLSVAMAVAENSVEKSKAMWGKLDVVQGYLVYKIGVLTNDNIFHIILVDAGNGKTLLVSEAFSKDNWKYSKQSDNNSQKKWKDHYANLSQEERELKKQQWSEVKEAFFALSIDERAKMIMHFMSMKVELESMSEEEKNAKKQEMKSMMKELLPLSVEEKTQKLREFVNSL